MQKCLLDLDGVIVDFLGGAMRLHNFPDPYTSGFKGWYFNRHWGMADEDLYLGMDKEFWTNLDWTIDGKKIFEELHSRFGPDNLCILTSPCPMDGCYDGKIAWIRKHLPTAYHKKFLVGPAKAYCAGSDRVLIDDNDDNINSFIAAGGHGILVPREWNHNRAITISALGYIKQRLA